MKTFNDYFKLREDHQAGSIINFENIDEKINNLGSSLVRFSDDVKRSGDSKLDLSEVMENFGRFRDSWIRMNRSMSAQSDNSNLSTSPRERLLKW